MTPWRDWPPARRIAAAALAVVLAWDVLALVRLGRDDEDVLSAPFVLPSPPNLTRRPLQDPRAFNQAAQRSPFGGLATTPPAEAQVAQAALVQHPRLTGTVVRDTDSFVVVELDGSVHLLHVGERVAGLTLRSVRPGAAAFDDSRGHRLTLHTEPPATGTKP